MSVSRDAYSSHICQVPVGFLPAGDAATIGESEFTRDPREVTEDVGRDIRTGVEGYQ